LYYRIFPHDGKQKRREQNAKPKILLHTETNERTQTYTIGQTLSKQSTILDNPQDEMTIFVKKRRKKKKKKKKKKRSKERD